MPSRPPERAPSRRRVLAVLGLGALGAPLAGCGGRSALEHLRVDPDWPGTPPPPVPDADELARREAAATARRLGRSAAAAAPGAASVALALVAEACAVHLQELGGPDDAAATPPDPSAPAAPVPAPSTTAPPDPAPPAAALPADLLADLVAAAGTARSDVGGTSPGLARLLASTAASRVLLAHALADATGLPPPALPAPVPTPVPLPPPPVPAADGAGAAPSTESRPTALVDVAEGALAASRAAEVAAASLAGGARTSALALRDALAQEARALAPVLAAAGLPTPVPAPGYVLPGPVGGAREAAELVVLVLEGLAATALDAVAALDAADRTLAADVLARAAVTALEWRPGTPELASTALPGTTSA